MADNTILSRLDGLKLKYEETGQKLTDPEVIADVKQFVQLNKEYKELEPIIETSERYRTALANLAEAPAGLPCHRVVNSAGRTVPGWTRQRELLEAEGVRFKTNGCADLARCGWMEIR